jgi:hypothetical protein
MIIQEQGDQLIVIRQTDHAILSGFFAQECGNETFERPEPFESFRLAAREHDNGWQEWELAPEIDPRTHLPYSFMSIPTEEHVALYQRGIERVVKADRYAGLLVSMHCASLYDRARATLPGFSAKYVKSNESHVANDFLQRLKLQQLRLKMDLRAHASTKGFVEEKVLERNAQILQAVDRLSLYFCLGSAADASIEGVPCNREGGEVDWELRWERNGASLSPYPFRRSPLAVSILARRVAKRVYGDAGDFQRALARSRYFALNFTLCGANATDQTKSAVA